MRQPIEVLRQWIEEVQENGRDVTQWESDFVASLGEQLERSGRVSERQEEILERIYAEKNSMTPTEELTPEQLKAMAIELSGQLAKVCELEPESRSLTIFEVDEELADMEHALEQAIEMERLAAGTTLAVSSSDSRKAIEQAVLAYTAEAIRQTKGASAVRYLEYCKSQMAAADAEIIRLVAVKNGWEGRLERMKAAAMWALTAFDVPRLRSAVGLLYRQKSPPGVEVTNAELVPEKFVRVTVQMPVAEWNRLKGSVIGPEVQGRVTATEFIGIRDALVAGEEVPGAEMRQGEHIRWR